MRNLVLVAALALYGLYTSYAVSAEGVASADAPNLVAMIATTTTRPTTTAHVTATTTTRPTTTAHVTATTTTRPTTTATTTTRPTTTATTATRPTTTAHVTNLTTTRPTTTAHVTNLTTTRPTTAHVTNMTTTNHTTTMHTLTTVLPTLSPNCSLPKTGHYNVSIKNTTCIKAAIGIQLIIKQNGKDMYFNVPLAETVASGKCGNVASWIILKFNSGFVNFTFVKDGNQYYISEISVALRSMNNLGSYYHGMVKNVKLFTTTLGHAYRCKSKQVVALSPNSLQILIVDTQLQAFDIPGGKFGKVEDCYMDHRFIVPIIFGVALFVLIIIVIIVYLACRHRRAMGYQRI
ncbi:lysosome-associated membrane glycoprotein 3-like isoform X2 [Heptranchias perlo]|uniref:lysosome-associated membrane glycoprotein 3-like isoform X2 n=1 Tax=Heptranchias perlo TaxID=212740 RepID=UPI003559DB78